MRYERDDDPLDPALRRLLAARPVPGPRPEDVARLRIQLLRHVPAPEPEAPRGSRRRLGFASLAGGGLWAALTGTAAAHRAGAAAVGLALVLGGSAAAEASGLGSTVRDAVAHAATVPAQIAHLVNDDEGDKGAHDDSNPSGALQASGDEESDGGGYVTDAPDAPGNLRTRVEDGSFRLRAVLLEVDGSTITVEVAGEAGPEVLTLAVDGDARINAPRRDVQAASPGGALTASDLEAFEGHLVSVAGTCPGDDLAGCLATSVTVQGFAGQPPAGPPSGVGPSAEPGSQGAGQGNGGGPPGDAGRGNGRGPGGSGPPGLSD